MGNLVLDALEKATIQLEKGIKRCEQNTEDELLRDGLVQRFEYTLDLSWKFLQRCLKERLPVDDRVIRSRKDIFREAARLHVIDDAESWILHYDARDDTSHDYDEAKAKRVHARAALLLLDVKKLIKVLETARTPHERNINFH
jgi:nucleotidyltransferase substrate binding protein (TIGR01987 family)